MFLCMQAGLMKWESTLAHSGQRNGSAMPDAIKLAVQGWLRKESRSVQGKVAEFIAFTHPRKYVGLELRPGVHKRWKTTFKDKGLYLGALLKDLGGFVVCHLRIPLYTRC